ncbi:MAG: FecR domain-containing protein [Chitinivibrionales bacterium]|nr:FecR domain-containing protein [Chitinivibrionales bacterium]
MTMGAVQRLIFILFVCVSLCSYRFGYAEESSTTDFATVSEIIGTVQVQSDQSKQWSEVPIGKTLGIGAQLRTFLESSCELRFKSGSVLKIGENSVVELKSIIFDEHTNRIQTSISLHAGQLWANVKKLVNRISVYEVETPTSVAAIRGTRFGVFIINQQTIVDVYEGKIALRAKRFAGEKILVAETRAIIDQTDKISIQRLDEIKKGKLPQKWLQLQFHDPFTDKTKSYDTTKTPDGSSAIDPNQRAPLTLTLVSPQQGDTISQPQVTIMGSTAADAKLSASSMDVAVAPDGSFNAQIPIPDEQSSFSLLLTATRDKEQVQLERSFYYQPRIQGLRLEILSPLSGEKIKSTTLLVRGITTPGASIYVNEKSADVNRTGMFSAVMLLREEMIGTYTVTCRATSDRSAEELVKSVDVIVDNTIPMMNTSAPQLHSKGALTGATRQPFCTIQAFDKTPNDQIHCIITCNKKQMTAILTSGETVAIDLEEGINTISVKATDEAGNSSNALSGTLYFLPGHLSLDLRKPSQEELSLHDLPPMPGGTIAKLTVEVMVNDELNTLPQTIKYCKINGTALQNAANYLYRGMVTIQRGTNAFLLEAEDIAGNKVQKRFTITITE